MITLNQLVKGQLAQIVNITGDDAVSTRLMEMGMIDGEKIQLVGTAPLGDPLEFSLRGYRLSLRSQEAQRVEVRISD